MCGRGQGAALLRASISHAVSGLQVAVDWPAAHVERIEYAFQSLSGGMRRVDRCTQCTSLLRTTAGIGFFDRRLASAGRSEDAGRENCSLPFVTAEPVGATQT
jgi:hypothetical protein